MADGTGRPSSLWRTPAADDGDAVKKNASGWRHNIAELLQTSCIFLIPWRRSLVVCLESYQGFYSTCQNGFYMKSMQCEYLSKTRALKTVACQIRLHLKNPQLVILSLLSITESPTLTRAPFIQEQILWLAETCFCVFDRFAHYACHKSVWQTYDSHTHTQAVFYFNIL